MMKKFGWKLSHFTLRMLATVASSVSPAISKRQLVAQPDAQGLLELRGERDERLAGIRRRPPAARDDAIVRPELGVPR